MNGISTPDAVVEVGFFARDRDGTPVVQFDIRWSRSRHKRRSSVPTPREERELTDALADLVELRRRSEGRAA